MFLPPSLQWLVLALIVLLSTASFVSAQDVPAELQGDWGEAAQCQAQADAGANGTVADALDAPYRFDGQWMSRWFFYCRVLRIDPLGEATYRVRVLCGEDAVERPWEIDIVRDGDTLNMTWIAVDEDGASGRPWPSGPFQRCAASQS